MDHAHLFSKKNGQLLSVFLGIVSIFFFFKILQTVKEYRHSQIPNNQISVSGTGEAYAVPDTAEITFSIEKESKTLKEAQDFVNTKTKEVLEFLKSKKVDDKDIKTISDNFYPQYDYPQVQCITYPCSNAKPILRGYQVARSFSLKVKNVDELNTINQGLADKGLTNLVGPNFVVGDEDKVKATARTEAIQNAKIKAAQIAEDLDIDLTRIVSFYEDQPYTPESYMSAKVNGLEMAADSVAPVTLPKGENKYTSTVTITYEIR